MKLFGKKKQPISYEDTLHSLKQCIKQMDQYETSLHKKIQQYVNLAKINVKENKNKSIYYLKCKKRYEQQLDILYNKKINIEIQIMTIENAKSNQQLIQTLSKSREYLKQNLNDAALDDMSEIMDDIQECNQMQDEMDTILSNPIQTTDMDDEVERELEELCFQETISNVESLPNVSMIHKKEDNKRYDEDHKMDKEENILFE